MFDMKSIGRKIALLRKEKNLTQMELADRLNISYQAVSNWERGETMPDVSKLPEISRIFNVSIDYILENQRITQIIDHVISNNLIEQEITIDEFRAVAPLLKPVQISEISSGITFIKNINDIIEYLPFVSKEMADEIAQKGIENNQILLDTLLPFISTEFADKLVSMAIENNFAYEDLIKALPFVTKEIADKIAQKGIENNQILLDSLLPFISTEFADKLVSMAIENNFAYKDLIKALPFVTKEIADKILMKSEL